MISAQDLRIRLLQSDPAALVRTSIDCAVALGALFGCAAWFGQALTLPYVVLALLVAALTFPGDATRSSTQIGRLWHEVLGTWLLVAGLLLLLGWATRTLQTFDERVLVSWAVATPMLQFFAHWLAPGLVARVLTSEGAQRMAVIVGANEMGRMLARRIESNPSSGVRFVGYFDDRGSGRLENIRRDQVLGALSDLAGFVKRHRIDVIYSALPMCPQPRVQQLLDALHDTTASIYFVPDMLLFDLIQARVETVGGLPVIAVCESPYYGLNALIKRASDLLLAVAITLLGFPVLLAIAIGVKRSSPGPVLFKQRRYGLDGREIVVYKFRTMTCLEDGDRIRQATQQDPRTTRFGAFLRAYSLDELPQFINVIQGRMSVVGPRPHAVAHNEMYRKVIHGYMIRHKVKPGITGLAQVRGLRGETETVEKMRRRIECDLEYLRNWSLWLDLRIVLKTVWVVVAGKNAY